MKHMYVSDDGKVFDNEVGCMRHEASLKEERKKRMKQSDMELFYLFEKKEPKPMQGIHLVMFFGE